MKQKFDCRREKMVKKAIPTMKKWKVRDKLGWIAECLIEGEDEMRYQRYYPTEEEKIIPRK